MSFYSNLLQVVLIFLLVTLLAKTLTFYRSTHSRIQTRTSGGIKKKILARNCSTCQLNEKAVLLVKELSAWQGLPATLDHEIIPDLLDAYFPCTHAWERSYNPVDRITCQRYRSS